MKLRALRQMHNLVKKQTEPTKEEKIALEPYHPGPGIVRGQEAIANAFETAYHITVGTVTIACDCVFSEHEIELKRQAQLCKRTYHFGNVKHGMRRKYKHQHLLSFC